MPTRIDLEDHYLPIHFSWSSSIWKYFTDQVSPFYQGHQNLCSLNCKISFASYSLLITFIIMKCILAISTVNKDSEKSNFVFESQFSSLQNDDQWLALIFHYGNHVCAANPGLAYAIYFNTVSIHYYSTSLLLWCIKACKSLVYICTYIQKDFGYNSQM